MRCMVKGQVGPDCEEPEGQDGGRTEKGDVRCEVRDGSGCGGIASFLENIPAFLYFLRGGGATRIQKRQPRTREAPVRSYSAL